MKVNEEPQLTLISSCIANRRHQQLGQRGGDQPRFPQLVLPGHSPFLCFHLQQEKKSMQLQTMPRISEVKSS